MKPFIATKREREEEEEEGNFFTTKIL